MKISFLGGAMEVGGSLIYLRVNDYGIVMDCGIRQGGNKDSLPDFRTIQEAGGVDLILISHAHMDHIGSLPLLSRSYPLAPIYMTPMSADLTRVLLYDSLKIMGKWEEEIPHYTENDVVGMLGRVFPIRYQKPMELLPDITVTFYPAGHIAGAACMNIQTPEGCVFYSGDFSNFAQRTIEGARIPKLRPDVAIFESTYGNRLHANRQVEESRLIDLLCDCTREGRKILIPAFALGRSQEVLLIIKSAMAEGKLPKVPVYVDGMVRDINRMYERNETYLTRKLARQIEKGQIPFYSDEIVEVTMKDKREELLKHKGSVIFVSSSGMLTGGPSALYAAKIAPMEDGCIIITGYQDEESPGRALLNLLKPDAEKAITLNGVRVPVRCQVHQVGLSAHADQSEIIAMADLVGSRQVFLVHGDGEAIGALGSLLSQDYKRTVMVPKCGETYPVYIGKARKQLTRTLSERLHKSSDFVKENGKELCDFLKKNYPGKAFTIDELFLLWSDKKDASEEELADFSKELLLSGYIERNQRRLYLYNPVSDEDIYKLEHKQVTMQDVELILTDMLSRESAFVKAYKKFGFYQAEKYVCLFYDFPDVIMEEEIASLNDRLMDTCGWGVKISDKVNHMEAELLIRNMFPGRMLKLATHADKKTYVVSLSGEVTQEDKASMKAFQDKTGWVLVDKAGKESVGQVPAHVAGKPAKYEMEFIPDPATPPLEQNQTFLLIDESFAGDLDAPYKKSLKNDHRGKYIELSFLSPMAGLRKKDVITDICKKCGHRMKISESYNQNKLQSEIMSICAREGISLSKNPAWLPQKSCMRIKTAGVVSEEKKEALREAFYALSACQLEIIE